MSTLLLGATGFIGPAIVRVLDGAGVEVVAASRGGAGPHGIVLDRRNIDAVQKLVSERRVTTVIDLLAYTEVDTLPLLSALGGKIDRWVMTSSGDVYRNYEGFQRKSAPAPLLGPLKEDSLLRTVRFPYRGASRRDPGAPDAWMDDYDKIPLETAIRSTFGTSGVVLRLPMIYGPGDKHGRFGWIIKPMLEGKESVSIDPAWAAWKTTFGYIDDVASAIATAATHPAAPGRTFNVGGRDAPDNLGWVKRFSDVLGWNGEIELSRAPEGSPLSTLNLNYPMEMDTSAFREACAWEAPTPIENALLKTVEAQRARTIP